MFILKFKGMYMSLETIIVMQDKKFLKPVQNE